MHPDIIPGFSALKLKEEVQAQALAELRGLSIEEQVRRLHESACSGDHALNTVDESARWEKSNRQCQSSKKPSPCTAPEWPRAGHRRHGIRRAGGRQRIIATR
jgi:hypothetical protein